MYFSSGFANTASTTFIKPSSTPLSFPAVFSNTQTRSNLCGAPASRAHTLDCCERHRNDWTRDSDWREGNPSEGPAGTVAVGRPQALHSSKYRGAEDCRPIPRSIQIGNLRCRLHYHGRRNLHEFIVQSTVVNHRSACALERCPNPRCRTRRRDKPLPPPLRPR